MKESAASLQEIVGKLLAKRGATVAVAESCTGGMLGQVLTSIGGSSAFFLGGIIAYSNEAKARQLGVGRAVLKRHGAVSEPTASQMALNARRCFRADYGISVTGIAGPGGAIRRKPVGLVFVGLAGPDGCSVRKFFFSGNRAHNRKSAVNAALNMLRETLTAGLQSV